MIRAPEVEADPLVAKRRRAELFTALGSPNGPAVDMPPQPPPSVTPTLGAEGQARSRQYNIQPGPIAPAPSADTRQAQYGITPGAIGQLGVENAPRPAQYGITPGTVSTAPASGAGTAPAGTGAFNYAAARDDWMGGPYDISSVEAAKKSAAAWAAKHGIPYDGSDVITLPNGGGQIDIIGNFKSGQGMARNWTPAGGNGLGGPTGAGPGSAGGPAGPGAGGGLGAAGGGVGGDFNSQVRTMLMQQLGQMGQTPGAEDPIIKNQVDAYRNEKTRAGQSQRAALAERAAASGLNAGGAGSGAFDTGVQGIQEGIGEDVGQFSAGAVSKELYNRRDKMTQLLNMALQSGDADMARALQLQIAQMDNKLRYATLGEQGRQFDLGFGENKRQFNDQFGRSLGRDAEDDQRWRLEFGF